MLAETLCVSNEWEANISMRRALLALVVTWCSGLLAGCVQPTATPLPTALEAANLPTAVPLWTPTSTRLPSPTLAEAPRLTATPRPSEALDPSVVAMVNGVAIRKEDYERQVAQAETYFLTQPGLDIRSEAGRQALWQARERVLGWMIDQVLIQQAAAARGIAIPGERIEAEIVQMRGNDQARFDRWLSANGLTLESLREQLRLDLVTAAVRDGVTESVSRIVMQIHARHILTSDESAARDALQRLKQGENFIALAREASEDQTTRPSGGDLGFLPKGVMPPSFEEAAFAVVPGDFSDVVRSEFGFHIIQVVEIDPEREVTDELWPVVQQRAFDQWLAGQRAKATIVRNPALAQEEPARPAD